jgi:hypothetical protein
MASGRSLLRQPSLLPVEVEVTAVELQGGMNEIWDLPR